MLALCVFTRSLRDVAVFDIEEDPANKSFFSEIISSISGLLCSALILASSLPPGSFELF